MAQGMTTTRLLIGRASPLFIAKKREKKKHLEFTHRGQTSDNLYASSFGRDDKKIYVDTKHGIITTFPCITCRLARRTTRNLAHGTPRCLSLLSSLSLPLHMSICHPIHHAWLLHYGLFGEMRLRLSHVRTSHIKRKKKEIPGRAGEIYSLARATELTSAPDPNTPFCISDPAREL